MNINTPVATIYGSLTDKYLPAWRNQVAELRVKFADAIEEVQFPREFPTEVPIVFVRADKIVAVLEYAKTAPGLEYNFLSDITATDEEQDPRFHVVYNLLSHATLARIRFKVRTKDGVSVPTAVSLWPAANWAEREVFDMFGVQFEGHPDLRRILMDERWVGHPLRKDYPLRGYQIFPTPQEIKPELLE